MKLPKAKAARPIAKTVVSWLVAWPLCLPGQAMASAPRTCPGEIATVSGAVAQDFDDICQGVASALTFFVSHGVPATEALSVRVDARMPEEAGATAAGCYLERLKTIHVVPYTQFRKNKTWFGVPIDRAMYRSLASHEAAHAVAACRFLIPKPTIQAKEYLAYVAMFSTMPVPMREKALAGLRGEAFDSFDRFTPLLYMFDPMRFGAGAYRHFSSLTGPTSVVQAVLSGQALSD